MKVEQLIRN